LPPAVAAAADLPAAASVYDVERVFDAALDTCVKGVTVYRSVTRPSPAQCRSATCT
jgi:hypothetical protein